MQESKMIELRLKKALQNLNDAAMNKAQEVKYLKNEIEKLSIENRNLKNTITDLRKSIDNNSHTIAKSDINSNKDDDIIDKGVSQDIDISIKQLKNILNKNQSK